jgi:hypothetical protein
MSDPIANVAAIRRALPAEGLFAEKEWRVPPEPFPLGGRCIEELEKLGHRLHLFVRACDRLYQLSVRGKQPAWIAGYLDRGKPPELVALAREKAFRHDIPLVIRPDVILTENGLAIAELDSVPGGIGLTAWLNQTYAALGFDVIGGPRGMIDGFRSIVPDGADIIVSDEAATYRPEMQWLARQLNENPGTNGAQWRVVGTAENRKSEIANRKSFYRFFELFDLPNIPCAPALIDAALRGDARVTPPFKPHMEEKMWFALFWMRPLREFWRRELSERHFLKLQKVIPYTWIIDPSPLPHNAAVPRLDIHDWRELGSFSQKQRDLIMKVSGFSELGWGSRGVSYGHDLPQHEWKAAVGRAVALFDKSPRILQEFHKGRLVEHSWFDPATGTVRAMQGRARLCPYYFIGKNRAQLGGILATICPADKKLLHGMTDAILAPCARAAD